MKSIKLFFPIILLSAFLLPSSLFALQSVERFKPIEIPVSHSQLGVKNVWDDVTVTGILKSPSGEAFSVSGFYHSKDLWMVRFAPEQIGTWKYQLSITDKNGQSQIIDSFLCIPSSEQGFIRLHPTNPKRWIYSGTGNLYTAVGFGDCMGEQRNSILGDADLIDGGFRSKGYHEGINWILPYSQYLIAYGDAAGFNIYRYSDGNCAYSNIKNISTSGNDFDTLHLRWTDTLFNALRAHGFRIFMTILATPHGNSSDDNSMAATFKYVQHCIDRYGSLVDFWELVNESSPDSLWISKVSGYIHAKDPYHHLVSMSWETPNHPAIDIISPHWYGREDVRSSDQTTADKIASFKQIPKPVIFGEQGQGLWDSLAAMRLRGRIWSALFNEGIIVFWNSSFAKDCDCNQYLGWEERRYVRVLQNFSVLLDSGVRKIPLQTIGHLKAWGLQSSKTLAFYIRDDQDVKEINSAKQITVTSPVYGTGYWYNVHSGDMLGTVDIGLGQQTLEIPNFQTDIAFIARYTPIPPFTDTLFRLDVNPRTVDLLNTPIKTPRSFDVQITNIGKKPITVINGWTSSPSSKLSLSFPGIRNPFPFVLNASQSVSLPVLYIMSDTGGTGAMLSFQHDASPAWENVAIDATGILNSSVSENSTVEKNVKIFPDPANDKITVERLSFDQEKTVIRLYTTRGVMVAEKNSESGSTTFDVGKLPSGSYQIIISAGGKVSTSKKVTVLH